MPKKSRSLNKMRFFIPLENIIALLPGNIYWLDKDGVFLGCNNNMLKGIGLSSINDYIGKTYEDLYEKDHIQVIKKTDKKVMDSNTPIVLEEVAISPGKKPIIYLTRKEPLHDSSCNVIGLLGVSIDITKQKKMQETLLQTKHRLEAMEAISFSITHELRTPLSTINLTVSGMKKTLPLLLSSYEIAKEQIAIQAFNEKVIDHFIRKDEASFEDEINQVIYDLQLSFFRDSSGIISSSQYDSITNLRDPAFIKVFFEICQKNNIAEYYLLDTDGSFFLVDYQGNAMILAVKNEQSMSDAYEVALNADETFPDSLLKDMEDKKKILCLYEQEICDDPQEAQRFSHSAKKVTGQETYYYALVTDLKPYNLDLNILSFKDYNSRIIAV